MKLYLQGQDYTNEAVSTQSRSQFLKHVFKFKVAPNKLYVQSQGYTQYTDNKPYL